MAAPSPFGFSPSVEATASAGPTEFLDLKAQFATIRAEVMDAISRVMESQKFILGEEVRLFEEEIAAMLDARHAVACASGSDALVLALMAAGVRPGDEVITSPFTFVATAGSIVRVGATPVFADIDPQTLNIDPNQVERVVTPASRAIIPVHLFGLPADLDPILALAKERGLTVIEDAAQAIGARYRGHAVGTIGDFGCFSFFPSKNLGGAGDGGLVVATDPAAAEKLRVLRVHGSKKKYHHELVGMNSRLDALQAAILRVKLRYLEVWTAARQVAAQRYRKLFAQRGLTSLVRLPAAGPAEVSHVYNQFTIRCDERDALREFLRVSQIATETHYPIPLHLQPAFSCLGYWREQFPNAECACREVLSLPLYPELQRAQQESVVQAISNFYASRM